MCTQRTQYPLIKEKYLKTYSLIKRYWVLWVGFEDSYCAGLLTSTVPDKGVLALRYQGNFTSETSTFDPTNWNRSFNS